MIFFFEALVQISLAIALITIPACTSTQKSIESNQMQQNPSFDIIPASQKEIDLVDDQLAEFSNNKVTFTQSPSLILKNYIIKDHDGKIIAGIKADIYHWRILYIEALFIDDRYRGKGLGTALLNKVESEAKEMGARLAHLDTFDFQAKDFYLKHGYEIFGTLEDCPEGHRRYYLKKRL